MWILKVILYYYSLLCAIIILVFGKNSLDNMSEADAAQFPNTILLRFFFEIFAEDLVKNRRVLSTRETTKDIFNVVCVACCVLYVVCCMLFVVCCMLFVVCCLLFVVCCMLYVVLVDLWMANYRPTDNYPYFLYYF